jgi:predicted membrane-bound spermidine synthase
MTTLAGWENFYVIVGSSAGALIGLQFVVLTLISQMPIRQDLSRAGAAFSTPTIVHFGTVLLLSAILNAPWHGIISAAVAWGLVGLVGIVYTLAIARHMREQTLYQPVFEDWLCHAVLPAAAYATLAISAYATQSHVYQALFGVAAAALLLLFCGIHNAWDAVTYHVLNRQSEQQEPESTRREQTTGANASDLR